MATLFGILFIILIIALILAVILTVMEKITKFVIPLIIVALLVLGTFYFVSDVADIQMKFNTEKKLFLLELDDSIVGAFALQGEDEPETLFDFSGFKKFEPENADSVLNGYYKIVLVHWDVFSDVDTAEINNIEFSNQQIKEMFKSGNPRQYLPENARELFPTDDSLKSSVFLFLFADAGKQKNLIDMYRDKEIDFYPETTSLKVIKLVPDFILNKMVSQ